MATKKPPHSHPKIERAPRENMGTRFFFFFQKKTQKKNAAAGEKPKKKETATGTI